ncbi:unnamed protein product [Malassezia sympodialis ATCC 42132]|uniref:uncharacterized protein n=1 Tax=Malassezia sympodialis (strain ATCC 42132) TaxID=1230383 RepID=UPI0002C1AD41|nr:uncharacterized protein MSY001_2728 [Malassezia sympodialis ATCC 42132]CCV00023.1 unnamed protein product [Malassezia sympodialis ATCC 42132]|eukprot:XP_018741238.1 uncharacterized protein MSY001_2728 [Malassezia sympodialis ATCC 42132]
MEGVGAAERKVVSYCTKSGRGTRVIPPGTLKSVHFVKTPNYVQVSGMADFSKMFINSDGGGGELDPHGEDGMGNPIGGLVFTNAFGHKLVQAHEWHSFMDPKSYCLRVCKDSNSAWDYCKNIYDELGCNFNMPTGPDDGNDFESCEGDSAQIVGVYTENGVVSTFFQSQTLQGQSIPPPKPAPPVSQCKPFASSELEGSVKAPFANAVFVGRVLVDLVFDLSVNVLVILFHVIAQLCGRSIATHDVFLCIFAIELYKLVFFPYVLAVEFAFNYHGDLFGFVD